MTGFAVWAPRPGRVELEALGRRFAMQRDERAWWSVEVPGTDHGTDYGFALDGGDPVPDPRSPWQPAGVDGPSRVVDHAAFRWHDGGWRPPPFASAVVYELHIGTFTPGGTFDTAIERLPHLVDLGVTHVEVMPVNEFGGRRGWGYDGVDLFAPHHVYGGPDGLKRFVDACHGAGLAVLLDVVYNHVGPTGNYLERFGPYATERHRAQWGLAVNFDGPGSDEVRRFVCDNALMWLRDYHVDGLRLDAVHAMIDTSALHVLEQLTAEVARLEAYLGRDLVLVAESDLNDPRLIEPPEAGGYGLDAQWNDDFHHALHTALLGERHGHLSDFDGLPDLAESLRRGYVYAGRYSRFRGRRHGRALRRPTGRRLVGFVQNHDQVGNRAAGERTSLLLDDAGLRVAAAILLTAPFVPLLFQGEEWAAMTPFLYFTDHPEEIGRAIRAGRRADFAHGSGAEVPDPQAPETMKRSRLAWSELDDERHAAMLDWHRRLIELRRSTPGLADGDMDGIRVDADSTAGWLVVERGSTIVACNLSREPLLVPVSGAGARALVLGSAPGIAVRPDGVELPPMSAAILEPGQTGKPGLVDGAAAPEATATAGRGAA